MNKRLKLRPYLYYLLASFVLSAMLVIVMPDENYLEIKVKPGDTIYGIALKYEGLTTLSVDEFVSWVINNNHVYDDVIYPGDTLLLPVNISSKEKLLLEQYSLE